MYMLNKSQSNIYISVLFAEESRDLDLLLKNHFFPCFLSPELFVSPAAIFFKF